jgi:hypothetical protein
MSLKAVQLIFITAASLLACGVGAWMLRAYAAAGLTGELIYGGSSLVVGLGLLIYEGYFIKKLKHVSYL